MSLLGLGAAAIWHDIVPEHKAEFYAWHGQEHMLERVGIPGFRRGRRYLAVDADLEFFNLYETDSPGILVGQDYRARLEAPTPWTQAVVKQFRRVARSLCRVVVSRGRAQGGLVATWRYELSDGQPAAHEAGARKLLESLAASEIIAGAHLLMADTEASSVRNAEERARSERNEVPGGVLLVEGWGEAAAFAEHCRAVVSSDALKAMGAAGSPEPGIYQLQVTVAESDLT